MVILVKDENGLDRAIDFVTYGWKVHPVDGNDSIVDILFNNGEHVTLPVSVYNNTIGKLITSGEIIDARVPDEYPR